MSGTNVQECNCCEIESDCINGLCELCSDYNYNLQKEVDYLRQIIRGHIEDTEKILEKKAMVNR